MQGHTLLEQYIFHGYVCLLDLHYNETHIITFVILLHLPLKILPNFATGDFLV